MDSDEVMNSNGQLKRKKPAIIYSDEGDEENIIVQTVSADTNMNIAQRETPEQRSHTVANTVEQQQQNIEQRHTHGKKKKRLSADSVEYGIMTIFRIRFYFRIFTKILRLLNSSVSHQYDFLISFSSDSFDAK